MSRPSHARRTTPYASARLRAWRARCLHGSVPSSRSAHGAARGGPPRLVGSAFFVDSTTYILCTCCHVIDDIATMARMHPPTPTSTANASNSSSSSTSTTTTPRPTTTPSFSPILDPHTHGVALGFGSPAQWTHIALVRRVSPPPAPRDERNGLDLAILQLVGPLPSPERRLAATAVPPRVCVTPTTASDSSSSSSSVGGGGATACRAGALTPVIRPSPPAAAIVVSADENKEEDTDVEEPESPPSMPEVTSLPIGEEGDLGIGEDVLLLGYGQAGRGIGPPACTATRGVYAGGCEHPITGSWLRTDALMLSGHSGGPLLNRRGEVVGWSVRSGFDRVLNGDGLYASGLNEVRPASALLPHVSAVLGGRLPSTIGMIPAGYHMLGAAEAMAALAHALAAFPRNNMVDVPRIELSGVSSGSSQGSSQSNGGGSSGGRPSPSIPGTPTSTSTATMALETPRRSPPAGLLGWLRSKGRTGVIEQPTVSRENSPSSPTSEGGSSSQDSSECGSSPSSCEKGQHNKRPSSSLLASIKAGKQKSAHYPAVYRV